VDELPNLVVDLAGGAVEALAGANRGMTDERAKLSRTGAGATPLSAIGRGIFTEGLRKTFGGVEVVAGLTLSVAPGEIYGLIGPNGAGKSTTFRMLTGLIRPDEGRIFIDRIPIQDEPLPARRRLGVLGGGTPLYARLTVREALTYSGRLYGMEPGAIRERIVLLSAALGLEPLLDRWCEHLSMGERQRSAIARAVLHDPSVLLLDEPTSGLDVLASRALREFILLERTRGRAVLFSTHYLAEAELLCQRVGLLYRGSLVAEGPPAEVRAAMGADTLEEAFLRYVARSDAAGRP
jgi:sodium transport system ATP-binding protein